MIRGNKKGQEGVTLTTMLLLILGLVVVVLVIIGFTMGWDTVFGKFKFLPGQDLETVKQACGVSASSGLSVDYCSFKSVTVSGVKEEVNCEDTRLKDDNVKPLSCAADVALLECAKLSSKDFDALRLNGKLCVEYGAKKKTCVDQKVNLVGGLVNTGVWKAACEVNETDFISSVQDTKTDNLNGLKECCVVNDAN